MRFRTQHRFSAPVGAVVDVLSDPSFHRDLELPDVRLLDVVKHSDDGNTALLSLRFQYVGRLDANVRRLLRGRRLTWIQTLTAERASSEGRLSFAAENAPDRLHGSARFTLQPDGDQTVWELDGEVRVRVPLVGGGAERAVTRGFLERLEIEVRHANERLGTGGSADPPA